MRGPGPGRESAVRALNAAGLKVTSIEDVTPIPHNGCRPPRSAASDRAPEDHGEVSGTEVQALAPRGHRPVPEERREAARVEVQARGAAGRRQGRASRAGVRLWAAAAREAEAAPHVRRAREAVPGLLLQGRGSAGCDRRDPPAVARGPSRQRRLPDGLRLDAQRSAPAREPPRGCGQRPTVNIPSYQCKAGDVVGLREKTQKQARIQQALQIRSQIGFPGWVEVDERSSPACSSPCPSARTSCRTSTRTSSSSCIRSNSVSC